MKIFIAGASGATGQKLTTQLLKRGHQVVTVIRATSSLPHEIYNHNNLSMTRASLLGLSNAELKELVAGCDAVASCLGHNLTLKGMFGPPRKLVTDATRRLCQAIKANQPQTPVKFVLMNTTGNRNRDIHESQSLGEKIVVGLLRVLLPPQADNEQAVDYLRTQISKNDRAIEWSAVRPDSLIDEETVTEYTIHPSPIRSPIFDPGKTSRINVAHFMATLITDDATWQQWKGQMPVIYNNIREK
jgi:nucleoside-diphosphate-sugar epimerase